MHDPAKLAASALPAIPAKRYFSIGEVAELCGVKPHVLRYWEQEFTQLRPVKRKGNRRYYQHHEVLMIRRIRQLLYEEGFTISGARNRLDGEPAVGPVAPARVARGTCPAGVPEANVLPEAPLPPQAWEAVVSELRAIRELLSGT